MLERLIKPFKLHRKTDNFYRELKGLLGYSPRNFDLYKLAMVHRSATVVMPKGQRIDNERLEYLGDAILDAIVADYLFEKFPDQKEGFLTKMRAKIVSRSNLNRLAYDIGLHRFVKAANGLQGHRNIYGNALEALIGAMFIDKGYRTTSKVVIKQFLERHINLSLLAEQENDYKSRLLELAQKSKLTARFETIEENNLPESSPPQFVASLYWEGNIIATGKGFSKKEAEQNAAMHAMEHLDANRTIG